MIEFENRTDFDFDVNSLNEIYQYLTDKDVELILVDNDEIKELNKRHRNKNNPTDVLSFPLNDTFHSHLGSIIISIDKAKEAAKTYNHSVEDEIKLLFIHGLLHLIGYDHEIDNGEMRKIEEEIITKFNLPKSLIIRSE